MRIGLVQVNNNFSEQYYFPYSVGLLQSYLMAHSKYSKHLTFDIPIYARDNVESIVGKVMNNDVLLLSLYVWNERISLKIAEQVKLDNPKIKIIVGGPHVPNRSTDFLKQYPFIDIACHGEGERTICELVDSDFSLDIKGISYLRHGNWYQNIRSTRIENLNVIPSPYLSGMFDNIMEAAPNQKWIVSWETNRGCPFSCTFCDWGSSTQSRVYQFKIERLFQEIDWFANKHIDFVFCCDANFGILPRDLDIADYVAKVKQDNGFPKSLSVQNTKNSTERAYSVQSVLAKFNLNKGVTISMQSLNPTTLANVKRSNISLDSYQELQRRFTIDKIETYTDIILALPGETLESCIEGIDNVISNGQHNRIQFNNLSVLPNAKMGDPQYQKKYGMQIVETDIVNFHGRIPDANEIMEKQQLVVATDTLPREDWRKLRSYCWLVAFLYFDKTLQIPLSLLQSIQGISYRELFNLFSNCSKELYPNIAMALNLFDSKATDIQNGGVEYCHKKEYLDIYWPADEFILIKLITEQKFSDFYQEALELLLTVTQKINQPIIREAWELNKQLFHLPFQKNDVIVSTQYNIWEVYRSILEGRPFTLKASASTHKIRKSKTYYDDIQQYYREVIWWGNKKGAYLYPNEIVEPQIAGIF